LGRKFIRISLGGIRDEADIRGHRRTYIGALPGRIIQELRKCGANNPVFMLDEVDKIGQDFRGDPASALLEVLDPQQNPTFTDHYLDVPFDLSKVMFIATANYMDPIPPALRDRMEVIDLTGYTRQEKLHIAKKYQVPRQLAEHGLNGRRLRFEDAALEEIIDGYTREAGVRNLDRQIGSVCRSVAAKVAVGSKRKTTVKVETLDELLGPRQFEAEMARRTATPGVVTGLAFTPVGGEVLFIEATSMPGQGRLKLTGQLGDVMRESAEAAHSLVRSHARGYGIGAKALADQDIHIHVPAGAIPKDGPSAGVTMFTALVSLLTNRPARADVAMTGEITLSGMVLPIGGVKEKTLAAHRAGIATVLLPDRNRKDVVDIPEHVRESLKLRFMATVDEVLDAALVKDGRKMSHRASTSSRTRKRVVKKSTSSRKRSKKPSRRG
jgi:ATP-dependent Lon protease